MKRPGPEELIGKSHTDKEAQIFFQNVAETPLKDHFAEMDICDFPRSGLSVYFDKAGCVCTLFLYSGADDDHGRYQGPMPKDVSFEMRPEAIRERLGSPSISGKAKGAKGPWDRFDFEDYSLHLEYAPDIARIVLVTLMSPQMARGEI